MGRSGPLFQGDCVFGMSKRDYYEILGVERTATVEVIKGAYRKAAKEHHPDRNHGDDHAEVRFKEVSEAYEVLKDDQKRAAYDRFGHAAFEQGMGNARGGNPFDFASSFTDIFDDLFGEFTGGRKVLSQQGFFTIERTCPSCRGNGRIIKNPCKTCKGAGQVQKERTLTVDIPAGVEEGTRIRLSGEGQGGMNGGPPGDLYIFIALAPHQIFQRDGHDLYCRAPVSFVTASLGGNIEVPTLDGGRAKVAIPEGMQSGRQFRLRGKGMPVLRGGSMSGDLYVELTVETPVKLSKKQKELLKQFEEDEVPGSQPESEGFFVKVKEFWKGEA